MFGGHSIRKIPVQTLCPTIFTPQLFPIRWILKPLVVGWIKSYLAYHAFQMHIGNVVSEEDTASIYVPKGSVIGPLLFLVIINDLSDVLHHFCRLLTDNTEWEEKVRTWTWSKMVLIKLLPCFQTRPRVSTYILEHNPLPTFHSQTRPVVLFLCHKFIAQITLEFY